MASSSELPPLTLSAVDTSSVLYVNDAETVSSICTDILDDAPPLVGLAVQITPGQVGEVSTGAPAVIQICVKETSYVFHVSCLGLRGSRLPPKFAELLESPTIRKSGFKLREVAVSLRLLEVYMPEAMHDLAEDCRHCGITSKRNLLSPMDIAALFLGCNYDEDDFDGPRSWDGSDQHLSSGRHLEQELIESAGLAAAFNLKIGRRLCEIKASLPDTFSGGCDVLVRDSSNKIRIASGTVVPWTDGNLHADTSRVLVAIPFEQVNRGSCKLQKFQLDYLRDSEEGDGGADAFSTIKSLLDLVKYKQRDSEAGIFVIPWITQRCAHKI